MVIAYLRVSTGRQNPDNQMDEIKRFTSQKNIIVDKWVTETVSGKTANSERRLGYILRRMKKDDTLIVTEISRLSRTLTDIMSIMGICLKKGIKIYTTKEKYTFDDSINSKVLCFAFGLVAEIERNLISMRTKEALAAKKAKGIRLGRRKGSSPKLNYLSEHSDDIDKMLHDGNSISEVCRKMEVSRDTFYRYLKGRADEPGE
ncbi:MAG: recombinase family protein [Bacteroidales bacterium]|nr:recombinase family protein [Bacteroidales bacterium]